MNGFERKIIENNKYELVNSTKHPKELLESLRKRGVIIEYLYEELNKIENSEERLKAMYDILMTRGPETYEHLISALYETDNDSLGQILLRERYYTDYYMPIKVKKSVVRCDLDSLSYNMTSKPKGCALIVNFHNYISAKGDHDFDDENVPQYGDTTEERRFGSYRDVANLYTLLSQLGYEITILYDLEEATFIEQIEKFRDKAEHKNNDSCLVIIMGHGLEINDRYAIRTYDNKNVYTTDIWMKFNARECPALRGKPKIFIFQMCRGEEDEMGVNIVTSAKNDVWRITNGSTGTLGEQMSLVVNDVVKMRAANYESSEYHRLSNDQDFILIYPSSPGTTSKRDTVNGSWMIEKICKVFMENAWNSDVLKMMKMVREEIQQKFSPSCRQTTWTHESAKYVYFNPGLYGDEVNLNDSNSNNKRKTAGKNCNTW